MFYFAGCMARNIRVRYYFLFAGRVKAMDSKMEKAEDLKIPVVPLDM